MKLKVFLGLLVLAIHSTKAAQRFNVASVAKRLKCFRNELATTERLCSHLGMYGMNAIVPRRSFKTALGRMKEKLQQTYGDLEVVGGGISADYTPTRGYTGTVSGELFTSLEEDIPNPDACNQPEDVVMDVAFKREGITAAKASNIRVKKNVFIQKDKAYLTYEINFFFMDGDTPRRPCYFVNACDLNVIYKFDNIQHKSLHKRQDRQINRVKRQSPAHHEYPVESMTEKLLPEATTKETKTEATTTPNTTATTSEASKTTTPGANTTITEANTGTPETTPETNTTTRETNTGRPETSITTPKTTATTPEANTTITPEANTTITPEAKTAIAPEANTTAPEVITTAPEANTSAPEATTTTPEANTVVTKVEATTKETVPEATITTSKTTATTPEANTTTTPEANTRAPEANTTTPEANTVVTKVEATTKETVLEATITTSKTTATTPEANTTTTPEANTTTTPEANTTTTPEANTTTPEANTVVTKVEATTKETVPEGRTPGIDESFITSGPLEGATRAQVACKNPARGEGGNEKVGRIIYGSLPLCLNTTVSGTTCILENDYAEVIDLKQSTDRSDRSAASYTCFQGYDDAINGANSPVLDAMYFGTASARMFIEWYNMTALRFKPRLFCHYGREYENAFWDGTSLTFGDGRNLLYPLVSLDVVSHELAHGVTSQNSDLIYDNQSGGIDEAFSDMTGETTEMYATGSNDWFVAAEIFKSSTVALRYFEDPTRDGRSLKHVRDYNDNVDVHHSSGIFNYAFYQMVKVNNMPIRKAFQCFLYANMNYWSRTTTFEEGACDVMRACYDLGYNFQVVKRSFQVVGITFANCVEPSFMESLSASETLNDLTVSSSRTPVFMLEPPQGSTQVTVTASGSINMAVYGDLESVSPLMTAVGEMVYQLSTSSRSSLYLRLSADTDTDIVFTIKATYQ